MNVETYVGGMLQTNAYLVENGDDCFLVDAPQGAADFIRQSGKKPSHLLLTHQHFDHTADVSALQELGLKVVTGKEPHEDFILAERGQSWGIPIEVPPFTVDETILSGPFSIGSTELDIRHVPGHSPDSIVFYTAEHQMVFAGDTLFSGGIGRPDLPGGDFDTLISKIEEELMTLPDETAVLPGHGPATTIGNESLQNNYLK